MAWKAVKIIRVSWLSDSKKEASTNLIFQRNFCEKGKNEFNGVDIIEQGILKLHAQVDNKPFKDISDLWNWCTNSKASTVVIFNNH